MRLTFMTCLRINSRQTRHGADFHDVFEKIIKQTRHETDFHDVFEQIIQADAS
jgi:hypothetical protein